MPNSLVTRLTQMIALLFFVALLALVCIFYFSTRTTFVETQVEIRSMSSPDVFDSRAVGQSVENAFENGGWPLVADLVSGWRNNKDDLEFDVVVLDGANCVMASSIASKEKISIDQRDLGMLDVVIETKNAGTMELSFSETAMTFLSNFQGTEFGRMLVLPRDAEPDTGDRFARRVWRTAAAWLLLTVAIAMVATYWIVQRSLRPLSQLTTAAMLLRGGTVSTLSFSGGDVEFRSLFEAFNSASDAISKTEALRREFISDIAHELRTPLTNIRGQLEAIESGLIDFGSDSCGALKSETALLERLVSDFQQLAVSDAGHLTIRMHSFPLRELLENILIPMAATHSVRLNIDVDSDIYLVVDETRLKQVFGNLMDNSVVYNSERRASKSLSIRVTTECDGNAVKVLFADNGIGIDANHLPLIFDRFYRVEKSRSRSTGGSGLGLAIARSIVETMGGTITYVEDSNPGATFAIELNREPQ